ncbi:MAG: hypothetical protein H0V62_09960 [Gammaproteobacteria bacterium]|nr:hypothetical protein [Gammaproteobacteria bacterium]
MPDYDTPKQPQNRDSHTNTQASQGARRTADQVKQQARDAAQQAKTQADSMLGEQQQAAAGQLQGVAKALRKTAEQLDSQDQGPVARYAERAADSLDSLGDKLRDRDIDSLAAQVQDFARQQPGVFLGGAVAAGFLVARFLKSSARDESPSSAPGASYGQSDAATDPVSTP